MSPFAVLEFSEEFVRRLKRGICACIALSLAACGLFSGPEPEVQDEDRPWYNTTGLRAVFGDFDPADPLYVVDHERISDLLVRGRYLTENAAACGACHGAAAGQPKAPLSGGRLMRDSFGTVRAANITPDVESGIGKWNVGAVVRAIRASLDMDGRPLSLDLHSAYRWMSDEDAKAIAVYLLTRPPVRNEVERRELGGFERNSWGLIPQHREVDGYVPAYREDLEVPWGRYLAHHVSQCVTCHTAGGGLFTSATPFGGVEGEVANLSTPVGAVVALYESLTRDEAQGARESLPFVSEAGRAELLARLPQDGESSGRAGPSRERALEEGDFPQVGPDIRGNTESGLADWSREDIVQYLSSGARPDGSKSDGRVCPWPYYQGMRETDKKALAAFLKTL